MNSIYKQIQPIMSPVAFQEYMNSILSRLSDEQLAILTVATEKALQNQKESELKIKRKFESATWRQIDLLERIKNKDTLYRVERRILIHYLRTFFINPLTDLEPDIGNDQTNIRKLEARIQMYQDLVNLFNQKYSRG